MIGNLKDLIFQFSEWRRFSGSDERLRQIVFYSESPSYWPYFRSVAEALTNDQHKHISYLTSSRHDPILNDPPKGVSSFYIGEGSMRTIVFTAMKAGLVVMTTPDIGKSYFPKSKYDVHYAYLPHNMTSSHMVFRKHAFDGFDTIFCVGPAQKMEHREAEKLYGLKPRNLVESGYVKLDEIREKAKGLMPVQGGAAFKIVIAPTWGDEGLFTYGCNDLIESPLDAGHTVILRPHRNTEISEPALLENLQSRFGGHQEFLWARDLPDGGVYYGAHALVTDWSGAAFTFALGLERPVLFIDTPKKIKNPDFSLFPTAPLEVALRKQVGDVLAPDRMADAPKILAQLLTAPEAHAVRIAELRAELCFRNGDSASFTAQCLAEISERLSSSA